MIGIKKAAKGKKLFLNSPNEIKYNNQNIYNYV